MAKSTTDLATRGTSRRFRVGFIDWTGSGVIRCPLRLA